jgi:hypothetical protein
MLAKRAAPTLHSQHPVSDESPTVPMFSIAKLTRQLMCRAAFFNASWMATASQIWNIRLSFYNVNNVFNDQVRIRLLLI